MIICWSSQIFVPENAVKTTLTLVQIWNYRELQIDTVSGQVETSSLLFTSRFTLDQPNTYLPMKINRTKILLLIKDNGSKYDDDGDHNVNLEVVPFFAE